MQKQITAGSLLREYGGNYISRNNVTKEQQSLIHLLSACRTAGLGSHFERCDQCRYTEKSYNSCRNRHCPQCQQKEKMEWLGKRMKELLPVGYYHLVFTLPHELNPLCLQNKKTLYGLLFKAVSETIMELTRDVKHLGADIGLITVLHTWGQNMKEHPHLHYNFFIAGKVLAKKFRGKFLYMLKQSKEKGELCFHGNLAGIKGPVQFNRFLQERLGSECTETYWQPRKNTGIPFALRIPNSHNRPADSGSERRQSSFLVERLPYGPIPGNET